MQPQHRRLRSIRLLLALGTICATSALAQAPVATAIAPPEALVLDAVPPVPASLVSDVARYTEYKPTLFAVWHPTKMEMLVKRRHQNTFQFFAVAGPGAAMELRTDYPEPVHFVSRPSVTKKVSDESVVFTKDTGGNEVFRLYRAESDSAAAFAKAVPITPTDRRVQDFAWSEKGDRLAYITVPVNRSGSADSIVSELYIGDPKRMVTDPQSAKLVATLPGGGWQGTDWSMDDQTISLIEYVSINESHIWLLNVATGERMRFVEKSATATDEPVAYSSVQFSHDGKGFYALSDRDSEFKRLVFVNLKTRQSTVLTTAIKWDVERYSVSKDGKLIAFVSNEDGTDILHLMRVADKKTLPIPKLPLASLGGISWHNNNDALAISVSAAKSPSDVFSYSVKTQELTRWTHHEASGADPANFVEPDLVRWKSFDGLVISGFAYRPDTKKFPGRRPVLISIHGGPESQYTSSFGGRNNYFVNELGVAVIYPNVRGSRGFGKSFLKLDNWRLRENSVKDIKALFDWIAMQPDLDASRVMVIGGSYGGYMVLAVSTLYPEHIVGAIDVVGISNFVTFLQNTESYRRDLRRVEYGDERDPDMRAFLQEISPLNRADRITKPLFVVQGKNDPRVPYTEADQIVASLKKRDTPVWYMMANNEGHGFAKKANSDYLFYSQIAFMRKYLLGTD
ncbi:MAG: S9 family peptidase [Rhodocyclaceae bacterium]|nr:S9 family peptidase [Rhodocyclaceae bacterium]